MDKITSAHLLKKLIKTIIIGVAVSSIAPALATSIPNNSNPKTFLGPTAHLGVTKAITDITAFSVAGEAGPRNLRLGGTLGWEMTYNQRIKASAEFLRQKITYSFFDGNESPWLNQGALGVDYLYDFRDGAPYSTQLDLSGYVSHAPSKNLGQSSGTYINDLGQLTPYSYTKRLAGSNAVGVSPGVSFAPFYGTNINLRANYDNVRYDTNYGNSRNTSGFGGTVRLDQMIIENVNLGLAAAIRQPFNNYQADISWGNVPYFGTWIFKVFGGYTVGKNTLPTTYNVGVGADYLIDAVDRSPTTTHTSSMPVITKETENAEATKVASESKSMPDFKGERQRFKDRVVYKDTIIPPVEWSDTDNVNKDLLKWTSVPAVYIPQVYVVPDICTPVTFTGTIPDGEDVTVYVVHLNQYFVGNGLKYTVTGSSPENAAKIVITGDTLIIDGNVIGSNISNIVVTATNGCGSASSNAFNYVID